jgi:hypothetical protein
VTFDVNRVNTVQCGLAISKAASEERSHTQHTIMNVSCCPLSYFNASLTLGPKGRTVVLAI